MSVLASFMVPHPPLIVPAIGRGSESKVAATIASYEEVASQIAALRPETIVITSPHAKMYADFFHVSPGSVIEGSFASFGAPQVRFSEKLDEEFTAALSGIASLEDFPCDPSLERPSDLDHGTMVPLWFIRQKFSGGKIVRIGLSGLPLNMHFRLGELIASASEKLGRRIVIVASGDLSHKLQDYGPYGFAPEGPQYDERIMDVMGRGAFEELLDFDEDFCDRAAECGHRSFVIMAGAWGGRKVKATALSHEDVTGVGYGVCTFYPEGDEAAGGVDAGEAAAGDETACSGDDPAGDIYVRLARLSLETYIRYGKRLKIPEDISKVLREGETIPDELLNRRAGAFVSLHKDGDLRGCIGTIGPTSPSVAQEIANNAISASTRDPRFVPVRENELSSLEINVDVLGQPEDIASTDELDVRKYGVIVSTSDGRRGLLLPDLEGVDTVQLQVGIAMSKGGIMPHETIHLQRFQVIRHK